MLLGAIYGALIGTILALVTGGNVFAWAVAVAVAWAWAWVVAVAVAWAWALAGTVAVAVAWAWAWTGAVALVTIDYLAKRNKTTREELIENHTIWVFSLLIAIFDWFANRCTLTRHSTKEKSEIKQGEWDVSLIITLTQGLAEVFPEEWDEWQHWISDMMDSRKRMQAKGMNHRLVSLITFYRLVRFTLHIGIDKVFILATRRTTR